MTRPAHARSNGSTGDPASSRDDVLLDAAHSGDAGAMAVLRDRYRGTALAVARARTGSAEEAESVAEAALGRIEQVVGEGGGPRAFLGAFVVWMVGREADGGTRPVALPDDPSDPASVVRVFSGLPGEWQAFLWRTEILGHSARRAAAALGIGSVAAAGLHRNVTRGLRDLYGQAAADRAAGPDCTEFSGELAPFVRGARGQRSRRDVKEHLDGCARCTAEYLSREDIGTGLRIWTLPVLAALPLWGTEALELANLIAAAGAPSAGAGAAGAGTAGASAAAVGAADPRPDEPGTSPWSGRRVKVLLGAGALATAVAVAAVGATGGVGPVPAADRLAAEQAQRADQDTGESAGDDGAATGGERTGDEEAETLEPDHEQGSARPEETAAGSRPDGDQAGAPQGGVMPETASLVTGAGSVVAAGAGDASPDTQNSSGDDGAGRSGTGGERSMPVRGGAGVGQAETPDTSSVGGTSRDSSSERSSASTPAPTLPSAKKVDDPSTGSSPARGAASPSPVPSVRTSLPTVAASSAPLKAEVPPARATEPPSAPGRTGTETGAVRQHKDPKTDAPGVRRGDRAPQHREQSWSDGRKDTGHHGDDRDKGHGGRKGQHGGNGDPGRSQEHR